jgi:dipeptidyl-peptidase 4
MKRTLTLLLLLCGPLLAFTQERMMTIDEASSMNPKLNPANLSQLQWMGKSYAFAWVAKNCLIRATVKETKADTILKLDKLNEGIKGITSEPLKRFPSVTFTDETHFLFQPGGKYVLYDLTTGKGVMLISGDDKETNEDFDRNTRRLAYTRDNNLYIKDNLQETALSHETNPGIKYGSERVHRNEWGITKGTFWSPKGDALAFYRMDETMVADYPLVDITTPIATVDPVKYPMTGQKSHKVTLGVYHIGDGSMVYLNTDSSTIANHTSRITNQLPDIEFLTNVTWSPDGKYIYIATLNRDQNIMHLNKYDAATGEYVKTLFTETSEKYVEPMRGPQFFNDDPSRFIWASPRDGFCHLYLYDAEGNLISQLTKGPWVVSDILGYDPKGLKVFFTANREKAIDYELYSVEIKSGKITQLTTAPGYHTGRLSGDGKFLLDIYTSTTVPRKVTLIDDKGTAKATLLEAENPLKDYKLGEMTLFTIKDKDNVDLWCRLIKPANFDPSKKYPVLVYLYGGPHSQLVADSWLGGAGLYLNYFAEQGYAVFTIDNRGTSNRGIDFEQATFRNLGTKEIEDQMAGINYLKSLTWVDTTRFGITGWSYGGFMTISMMLRNPGVFKVAVAGGPVIDWKYYEVMYGERYMDTPKTNPDGYKKASLLNYVDELKGKLMLIHGYQDNVVVPQNSLQFIKTCVDKNKPVDFFFYPGHEHGVSGKDRVHLNQKMFNYFKENL